MIRMMQSVRQVLVLITFDEYVYLNIRIASYHS